MAYYGNLTEQELGFDAFIAPDDFDRHAQPVDIYEVFKYWYGFDPKAHYIYYYSDGNFPLTLTPTSNEYYKYGYTLGGVDVVVDVPLNSSAVTIFGETDTVKRWVIVYRLSSAKFDLSITVARALWLYCNKSIVGIRAAVHLQLLYVHMADINSITSNFSLAFYNYSALFSGRLTVPESVTSLVGYTFWNTSTQLNKLTLPLAKNIAIYYGNPGTFSSPSRFIEMNFGASTTLGTVEQRDAHTNLAILSVSQHNTAYASFDGCDIIYTKDLTTIHWLAPKTVRGLYLPDELPQSQIDLLGTKFSQQQLQNHQLYIGNQITNLTNLYLSNKSFVTIQVGAGNTAFVVENGILYNSAKTQLIKAGTCNTGDLIIPNTVTEILGDSFLRCKGYTGNLTIPSSVTSIGGGFHHLVNLTSLTLPPNYDTSIYGYFSFANFSAESLNTSILNLMGGTSGSPKRFIISKTSLDALNAAYPDAVSNAALRFINVIEGIVQDASLKLWLDASNPLSYPGTGTLWSDLSGNGNNGTMINGVAYSTANGGVMSFDGVNDTVNFPNSLIVSNSTGHTISLWIKRDNKTGYQGIMTVKNGVGLNCNILMLSGTSSYYSFAYGGTNMPSKSLRTPLTVGLWYNCTFVAYNYSLTLYINGEIITNTYSPSYAVFSDNNNIGTYSTTYLSAQLNEPLIYNRALTPEEVLHNFNATKSKYGL